MIRMDKDYQGLMIKEMITKDPISKWISKIKAIIRILKKGKFCFTILILFQI